VRLDSGAQDRSRSIAAPSEHHDLVATIDQRAHDRTADQPRRAGDGYAHRGVCSLGGMTSVSVQHV
jgi:hypothetical protein